MSIPLRPDPAYDRPMLMTAETHLRRRWMAALAKAGSAELEAAWGALTTQPDYTLLRRPETGLTMLQGRAGGTGQRFNLGEATLTRCTVLLTDGTQGFGYVLGRDPRHAELAALFDALLQDEATRPALLTQVIEPLEAAHAARKREVAAKARATRVEFFTMVRGED